ncbi:uncharacterized protein LOC115884115 isoform X2 [Sitophilus oryzae]|uniref:Uncharacterized protein LOC115884115 isoform X2 n=1 Tax=Sitophilus oryzae TaxID=7048 RepID=A0A6J2Y5E0_SITOR|nr:uncharacterized protein LOC115884115 isoform X2 [Sitophilus oryzae]
MGTMNKKEHVTTRESIISINSKLQKKTNKLDGEYLNGKTVKQRIIGPTCTDCRLKCDLRIAERFRQDNYYKFWGKLKTWEERRIHIRRLCQVLRIPNSDNQSRKKFLRKYYLELEDDLTVVCKTMFFNTFAISIKFIETTLLKYPENTLDETKIKVLDKSKNMISRKPNCFTSEMPRNIVCDNNDYGVTEAKVSTYNLSKDDQFVNIQNKKDIKTICSCPEKCNLKISKDVCLKIYEHFWLKLMSPRDRKLFLINTIQKDRNTSIRTFVLPIKNGQVTVCQEMYLNTLGLTEKAIQIAVSNCISRTTDSKQIILPNTSSKETAKDYTLPFKRTTLTIRPLQPPCSCKMQCNFKLTEYIRQQIHREFWNLPAQVDKKHFILSTISTQVFRDNLTKEKRKEIKYFMLPLYYDNIIVCREMYLQTLSIDEIFLKRTVNGINQDGSIVDDDDHYNTNGTLEYGSVLTLAKCLPNKYNEVEISSEDDQSFINCADLVESHIKEDTLHSEKLKVKRVRREKRSRKMGPPCLPSCRTQCSKKLNEIQRKSLHDKFWHSMNWQERKQFIMNTVEEFPIKNRSITGTRKKRNFSRKYTLPGKKNMITVCQKMYLNTLSLCSGFLCTIHIWASQVKW